MNEEIKEILEKPNVYIFNDECYLYFGDYNKLKIYITNLQEENQKLNKIIDELEKFLKEGCDLTCGSGITNEYIYAYENVLDKLTELKKGE